MVYLSKYCLWERLYFSLKGNFKKASRRLQKGPVDANVGDQQFSIWYYSIHDLLEIYYAFKKVDQRPIGFLVPPSYLEATIEKRSNLFEKIAKADQLVRFPFLANYSDHLALILKKRHLMRIVLTHGYFLLEDPKEQKIMRPYPPLGLLYISAFLDQKGIDNDLFDSTFASFEALKKNLLDDPPAIIGIYVNLMTKIKVVELIKFMREAPTLSQTKIVLGGPEVRHHRENFLDQGADVIVFGEGEETMLELVHHFSKQAPKTLHEIDGIAFRDAQGHTHISANRALISDLDVLPFPNRSKIDMQAYLDTWKKYHGEATISLSTMRGCPYGCKWCSRAVYGKSYRRRSPKAVAQEMASLSANYQFDKIWFVDDVFTINHKWLRGFVEAVKELDVIIPYEIITRADRMNEEVVQLLQKSGCFRVWIGAESGSQNILDAMNRMVKIKKVKEMVLLSKKYGIETGTFIMLGYPGETEKDIQETLTYLLDTEPDQYTITLAYPIKGTPLYEEVESDFMNNLDWETSTDREIDFKRTYKRSYYDFAIKWILHEVDFKKRFKREGWTLGLMATKLRATKARLGMALNK